MMMRKMTIMMKMLRGIVFVKSPNPSPDDEDDNENDDGEIDDDDNNDIRSS